MNEIKLEQKVESKKELYNFRTLVQKNFSTKVSEKGLTL